MKKVNQAALALCWLGIDAFGTRHCAGDCGSSSRRCYWLKVERLDMTLRMKKNQSTQCVCRTL